MGAGEALCGGEPLSAHARKGRPPASHLLRALDLAGAALAQGDPVPDQARDLIAKSPIPLVPFPLWRRLFALVGGRHWRRMAAGFGVGKKGMLARPYEAD